MNECETISLQPIQNRLGFRSLLRIGNEKSREKLATLKHQRINFPVLRCGDAFRKRFLHYPVTFNSTQRTKSYFSVVIGNLPGQLPHENVNRIGEGRRSKISYIFTSSLAEKSFKSLKNAFIKNRFR